VEPRDEVMTWASRHEAQSPTRSGGDAGMDDPITSQIGRDVAGGTADESGWMSDVVHDASDVARTMPCSSRPLIRRLRIVDHA
jgi:hypothetical protein